MSTIVRTENLRKYFPVGRTFLSRSKDAVRAVDGVNLTVQKGENLGLVGESGCGKTTLGRLILGLIEPTDGAIYFHDNNIAEFTKEEMHMFRRRMQIVFQNPTASLNPRKPIRQILSKPFRIHKTAHREELENKVLELLKTVGMRPGELYIDRYPHELSGGQKQRINIARALALQPEFIVADEPVSSLDTSVKVQILNLLKELKRKFRITCLFVTHELAVVRSICDRTAVMYLGKIVELAQTDRLFNNPLHPYTLALLSATPVPNPKVTRERRRIELRGEVPSPINPPKGCRFHTRCLYAKSECSEDEPRLQLVEQGHFVACHKF